MEAMKKKVLIGALAVILLTAVYIFVPGLCRTGSVALGNYSASEGAITLELSAQDGGYIRKAAVYQQQGGKLYLDCYRAFGGFHGAFGAKIRYRIPLDPDTETIALYRAYNAYEVVLKKDSAGAWQRVK